MFNAALQRPRSCAGDGRGHCLFLTGEFDGSCAFYNLSQGSAYSGFTLLREPVARAISQHEHLLSRGQLGSLVAWDDLGSLAGMGNSTDCHYPRQEALCAGLRSRGKCAAAGFCGLYANHQAQSLVGAQHFTQGTARRLRGSEDSFACAAGAFARSLLMIGLTEHLELSMCLLFHRARQGLCLAVTLPLAANLVLFDYSSNTPLHDLLWSSLTLAGRTHPCGQCCKKRRNTYSVVLSLTAAAVFAKYLLIRDAIDSSTLLPGGRCFSGSAVRQVSQGADRPSPAGTGRSCLRTQGTTIQAEPRLRHLQEQRATKTNIFNALTSCSN